jgi:hypothetical protein
MTGNKLYVKLELGLVLYKYYIDFIDFLYFILFIEIIYSTIDRFYLVLCRNQNFNIPKEEVTW